MAFDLSQYQPVEERLRDFWADHPNGRITTERDHAPEGEYVFMASVWRDGTLRGTTEIIRIEGADRIQSLVPDPDATGWAHESVQQLPPNMKASALEVCETSAIGRALANLGYAPKGARPSREEMQASGAGRAPEPPTRPTQAHTEARVEHRTTTAVPGTGYHGTNEPAAAVGGASSPGEDITSTAPRPEARIDAGGTGAPGDQSLGGGAETLNAGEGATVPPPDVLVALLEAVDGNETRAVNLINKAVGGGYRKSDLEGLSPDEWAAGLAAVEQ